MMTFSLHALVLSIAMMLASDAQATDLEARCVELGSNCITSETYDGLTGILPNSTPPNRSFSGDFAQDENQLDIKVDLDASVTKEAQNSWSMSASDDDRNPVGGMEAPIRLPAGHDVDYVMRWEPSGNAAVRPDADVSSNAQRYCVRYYFRYNDGFPEESINPGDIEAPDNTPSDEDCERVKIQQIGNTEYFQLANHRNNFSFNTSLSGGVTVGGDTMSHKDCETQWCRAETCCYGDLGNTNGSAACDAELEGLNTGERMTWDMGAPQSADTDWGAGNIQIGDLFMRGQCGVRWFSHFMAAEWATNNDQWIGPASEIESAGPAAVSTSSGGSMSGGSF